MAERLTVRRAAGGADGPTVERQIKALGYDVSRLAGPDTATSDRDDHEHHACKGRQEPGHDHHHDHAGHDYGAGAHAGHMHAHSEADEAEERAGVAW